MNYISLNELATNNIRALLGVRRESIEKLANETGISISKIKRRLLNQQAFSLDEIEKISSHFELKPSDIFSPTIRTSQESKKASVAPEASVN